MSNRLKVLLSFGFFAFGLILLILSPGEKTLGQSVKFVYFHGALILVTLIIFSLSAILSVFYLISSKKFLYSWASRSHAIAEIILGLNLLFSIFLMKLIWNGVQADEPRFRFVVVLFLISAIALIVSLLLNVSRVSAFLYFGVGVIFWIIMIKTGRVMHPVSPIMGSNSLAIKASFLVIFLSFFVSIFLLTFPVKKEKIKTS